VNGELREISLSRFWHAPGQLEAARHLLETMRWEWRERGTSLVFFADVHDPVMRLLGVQDRVAKELASFAVRAPVACSEDRLFYYA
jgi:hypothetical protein